MKVKFYVSEPLTDEQREFGHRWIAALRSGDYAQGKGSLRTPENSYCCLGVAADLVDPTAWVEESGRWSWQDSSLPQGERNATAGLSPLTMAATGILTGLGAFKASSESIYDTVAGLNDSGLPFSDIADLLEESLYDAPAYTFPSIPANY